MHEIRHVEGPGIRVFEELVEVRPEGVTVRFSVSESTCTRTNRLS